MERRLTKRSEKSYNQQSGCPASNRALHRKRRQDLAGVFDRTTKGEACARMRRIRRLRYPGCIPPAL